MADFDAEYFENIMQMQQQGLQESHRHRESRQERDRDRSPRDKRRRSSRESGRDRSETKDRKQRSRDRKQRRDRDERSTSRDHRQRKDRDHRRRQDSEERDPYYRQRRDIDKIRQQDPARADEMQKELENQIQLDKKQKELEIRAERLKEAQREQEEAKREDLTVLVYSLPLKANEKDIWSFFHKENTGKIRDIRIIRDPRSGRSKGVAYVEFWSAESLQKALMTNNKEFEFNGRISTIRVIHSQAEKNRNAANKNVRNRHDDQNESHERREPRFIKVRIGGLVDKLADIQEDRLKDMFSPFGQIDNVEIPRDPMSGKCRGFAFVQYANMDDARAAVKEMNGLRVANQEIQVTAIEVMHRQYNQRPHGGYRDRQNQGGYGQYNQQQQQQNYGYGGQGGYGYQQGRNDMQNQHYRQDSSANTNTMRPPASAAPTQFLLLSNMFNLENKTPGYFETLKRDVQEQCEGFGPVERVSIEKTNEGNVWVQFREVLSAIRAKDVLNNQYFDGNKVFCQFVNDSTFFSRAG